MRALALLMLAGTANAAVECKNVPGASALLTAGGTVLVGEVRGTNEIPKAFGELACLAVKAGVNLRVGIELPPPELGPLEKFLTDGDRAALLQATPFKRPKQD